MKLLEALVLKWLLFHHKEVVVLAYGTVQYPGDACSSLPGLLRVSYLWCNLKLSEVNAFFKCSTNDVAIGFVSSFKCEYTICKIKTCYTAPSRVSFLVALLGSAPAQLNCCSLR